MNENLEGSLEEAIAQSLELAENAPDSKERTEAINQVKILTEARNAVVKTEVEVGFKESEIGLEEDKLKAERLNYWLRIGLGVLELAVPVVFYGMSMTRLMRFEESGHVPSSPVFRNFLREIRPKK